jgi:hypothetical protein
MDGGLGAHIKLLMDENESFVRSYLLDSAKFLNPKE